MATINAIKRHYIIQALTRPKRPVIHIQKPQSRAIVRPGPVVHIQGKGRIINIKT